MKRSPKILVVEDVAELLDEIQKILSENGYEFIGARTFAEAENAIKTEAFDLVLLDLILPHGNGFLLIEKIRKLRGNVPILVQTTIGADEFCVRALSLGADDYVVKPMKKAPLLARIEALLRRATGTALALDEIPLRNGAKLLSVERKIIFGNGEIVPLTFKEAGLLRFLFSRGNAVSVEEILVNVWHATPFSLNDFCVTALVSRLRKKLNGSAEILSARSGRYLLKI